MDKTGTADENGNRLPVMKEPLTKKSSVLVPAVKAQLETALQDMKKSIINVKKSPWLLSRSSLYLPVSSCDYLSRLYLPV